jgi:hypothetical protein
MNRFQRFALTSLAVLLASGSWGCAARPRFKDQPVVWHVDDARNIPEPEERGYSTMKYMARAFATRRATRSLDIPDLEPARNTNALDELPDSTWFTNRIGRHDLSPAQAAQGPDETGPPQPPFTVVSGKSGGGNPGFLMKDRTDRTFLVKFDTKENPEMQTGGNIIVNRILWTLGYNVPADYVFFFRRDQLAISPKATVKDALLRKQPLTAKHLDEEILSAPPRLIDGRFRATASLFLDGVPKGGFAPEGTRDDDPNDTIPHQHRRELRGLNVFAAWLNHTDMKEDNTLDMYVEDGNKRYLKHYLLDFGEALGGHGAEKGRPEDGTEHFIDWDQGTKAFFALGLWKRPWEDNVDTPWPAIGSFKAEGFDPRIWRSAYPFWPFDEMDDADAYWGAKLVMRFDRAMLKAIVAQAQFSDLRAAKHMVDALYERRTIIGHTYLEAVTPLDAFRFENGKMCAYDLGIYYGVATAGAVERLGADPRDDDVLTEWPIAHDGKVCIDIPNDDAYRVYRLRIRRASQTKPAMQLHFKGGTKARILGVVRVE